MEENEIKPWFQKKKVPLYLLFYLWHFFTTECTATITENSPVTGNCSRRAWSEQCVTSLALKSRDKMSNILSYSVFFIEESYIKDTKKEIKYVQENFEECLSLAQLFTTQEHK